MAELKKERIEQILINETPRNEELKTILRGLYTRYRHVYETYYTDIDKLNDQTIAELKKYQEETRSLLMSYYMDVPIDICHELLEFDEMDMDKLLGPDWHKHLYDSYDDFAIEHENENKSEAYLKEKFAEEKLTDFYEEMDSIFRSGFGTGSKVLESLIDGIKNLFHKD